MCVCVFPIPFPFCSQTAGKVRAMDPAIGCEFTGATERMVQRLCAIFPGRCAATWQIISDGDLFGTLQISTVLSVEKQKLDDWLVVWNMFNVSIYWE